jgi:hypothetical protein
MYVCIYYRISHKQIKHIYLALPIVTLMSVFRLNINTAIFLFHFSKRRKYIYQRFTTYDFKCDLIFFFLNARFLHIITQMYASCVSRSSSNISTLSLTFQHLKSVSCRCSTLFYVFYGTCSSFAYNITPNKASDKVR